VTMEIRSYVALGDSFTEGLDDVTAADGGYRGWADRFAERLAARQPGLRYANLAVRGKTLGQIAEDQVPVAVSLRPDLVSLAAGGNDMLSPSADPDALAEHYDQVIVTLQQAGCPVLMFTGFDPRFPVLRLIRGKVAAFNMHLRAIADRHQCHVVDLWSMRVLRDPRAWSADRLHLAADGHRRVAGLRGAGRAGGRGLARALAAAGPAAQAPGTRLAGRTPAGCPLGPGARRPVAGPAPPRSLLRRRHPAQAPAFASPWRGARCARWPRHRPGPPAAPGLLTWPATDQAVAPGRRQEPLLRPLAVRLIRVFRYQWLFVRCTR